MQMDLKETVRNTVHDYLSESSPDTLEEFEIVFDPVYEALITNKEKNSQIQFNGEACTFGEEIFGQTIISMSCFVACTVIKAVLKDSVERDVPKIIDKLEKILSEETGKPKLVKDICERVKGVIRHF